MKFVLFVAAVVALLWLIKASVARRAPPPSTRTKDADAPQPMVVCAQCGLHLPRNEALPGRGGVFCGETHRADYERTHPPA